MPLRRAVLVLCLLLLPALLPEAASAAFAQRAAGSSVLNLTDPGDQANSVTVTLSGGIYTIVDDAGMGAGDNCNLMDSTTATCPAPSVATFSADLGAGDDTFSSQVATPTKVLGGTGQDNLTGGPGADELVGGPGNDTVKGGAGNDVLTAESTPGDTATGQNMMDGGTGDDTMNGGAGPDTLIGGPGNDGLTGSGGTDMEDAGDGNDTMSGGDGNDTLMGGPGNDVVGVHPTGSGASVERGNDVLDGGTGDDTLRPGEGPAGGLSDDDTMKGGDGQDQVLYDTRSTRVVVSLDGVANDGMDGEHDNVQGDVEGVTGGSADDTITGSAGAETLHGGPGGDALDGGAGADVTDGGDGNDSVNGGPGSDVVSGGPGDDQLGGGVAGLPGANPKLPGAASAAGLTPVDDNDTLDGGDGNDLLDGGLGADKMIGGPGVDRTSYATALSPVVVTLDGLANDGESGEGDTVGADVENLGGWRGQDTFTGSGVGNAMDAAGGEDYIDGAGGADIMTAGTGFDVVRARDGVADTVDCGGSSDFAIADTKDTVAKSCERVDRGLVKRPKLGRLVFLRPLHGGEAFGLSGMHRTVPLKDSIGVPFGSKLDATQGAVRVTSAAGGGHSQFGDFSQGAFLVKQRRSARAVTEIVLTGGDLNKCAASGARGRVTAARTVLRRLFGRAHGRFRSRGRFSTATVRGTEWSVIDRCDGTLTSVKRGTVAVRDRVKHRTVVLRSGQSYLARRGNR